MTTDQSKTNKNKKQVVTGAVVSLLIFIIVILFTDGLLFGSRALTEKDSIGYFSSALRDVRKKSPLGLAWLKVSNKDFLANGDVVSTGDLSQTILKIKNGQDIHIYDNSLIEFEFTKEGKIALTLKYGAIKLGEAVSDISIKNCGAEIMIFKGDDNFSLNKDKNCQDIIPVIL